ncbi:MAG: MBOAT family protein [Paludibacteraceae bacterium]|nr:MBOAT family protein [Paludibacteraceae bacterium]
MVFSSLIFLFVFLPIVLTIYFITPNRFKNFILFLSSLFFYTWGEGLLVFLLLGSAIFNFFMAKIIETKKDKLTIAIAIIANLGCLGFYKYFNFTMDNFNALLQLIGIHSEAIQQLPRIALPIGISFYTFQALSYCLDVYFGKTKANHNFINFATYLCMFPQLVAGPIVRYVDIEAQFSNRQPNLDSIADGVERFMIGFSKKVIIANPLSYVADEIFAMNYDDLSTPLAWIGVFAYSMQIYFDFSGYSDMAIGLGKMFGYNFLENFNYPYISKSIREFWRRWHISLSSWFRDYLYIPLGGNRKGTQRTYINLFIVFAITGLWHGASWNFVAWGLFHGLFLIIERIGFGKILEKTHASIQHIYTILVVMIGWVFFRATCLTSALHYIKTMFSFTAGNEGICKIQQLTLLNNFNYIIAALALLFSMPIFVIISDKFIQTENTKWIRTIAIFALFILAIIFTTASNYNPFIYFRF